MTGSPADRLATDSDHGEGVPESLAEVGRISSELLHDLGGALSVLEGRVALARSEATLGRATSPELRRIQEDTNELRRMVVDILDELRGVARSPEMAVPVRPLVDNVLNRWLAAAPLVSPAVEIHLPDGAAIHGPPTFFSRTLANLLRNAGRHARSDILVRVFGSSEDGILEVAVEDDGDGVDQEIAHRIFRPLVSGEEERTGLGLSFARWAVDRLGGGISVSDSETLGGAAFRLRIPLVEPGTRKRSSRTPAGPELLSGLTVAVVDDEAAIVRVLRRRLETEGAQVFVPALPVPDDLSTFLSTLDEEAPDAILLDLNLGDVSGLALHETMARRRPGLARRVVFLTGGNLPDTEDGPPAVSKLAEWDEVVGRILEVSDRPR